MNNVWRLYFLNVGDGDCVYLENGSRSFNLVIDGGRSGNALIGFLRERQVDRIDLVISTHCHQDHAGGLLAMANLVSVGEFWTPYPLAGDMFRTTIMPREDWPREAKLGLLAMADYQLLLERLADKQIPCRTVNAGQVKSHDDLLIRIAYPPPQAVDDFCRDARWAAEYPGAESYGQLMGKMNAASLFITLKVGQTVVHLPSDPPVEQISLSGLEVCQLLKLAHHGCIDGVSEALLTSLQPRAVVISAARDSGEFPSPETLALLDRKRRREGGDFAVFFTDTAAELPYLLFEIFPDGHIQKQ